MSRITISDVALSAGVSMKSVSRVINAEPNVSSRLRERVEAAIADLRYVPDVAARSLAAGRAFTLALLFSDYGDAFMPSYFPKLQSGAYRACRDAGYHLLVETLQTETPDFPAHFSKALNTMRVDGFILPPPCADDLRAMAVLEEHDIPFVRIAPTIELDRAPYVTMDDEAAARLITRHLWELGHRRFGLVTGRDDHPSASARRKGFADMLGEVGINGFAEAPGHYQFEEGIEAAKLLMLTPDPPTAIFATNDDSAAGVMAGLSQLGLRVPDDVSVAGFDDSWICLSVWPYLTTIHQPIAEMGREAVKMLVDRNGAIHEKARVMLDHHLVARGSTAAR